MKRIIIIDDNDGHRRMLKTVLEESGYETSEAEDGEIGCRLYRQQPSDLVITDIFMPKKEGIQTISDLTKEFPNVKIIAMSGGGAEIQIEAQDYLDLAKDIGAQVVMKKPIVIKELLKNIEELLQQ